MSHIPTILCPRVVLEHSGVKRSYTNESYGNAIEYAGGMLHTVNSDNPEVWAQALKNADGVLFPGGCDVHPDSYDATPRVDTSKCNKTRDAIELYVINQVIDQNIPALAICRGMQLMNVALRGTLIQDLPPEQKANHYHASNPDRAHLPHTVQIPNGNRLYKIIKSTLPPVNSMHHQGIGELASGLEVLASAPDGVIEAIQIIDHPYFIGVQWHPEELIRDVRQADLFRSFIVACAA